MVQMAVHQPRSPLVRRVFHARIGAVLLRVIHWSVHTLYEPLLGMLQVAASVMHACASHRPVRIIQTSLAVCQQSLKSYVRDASFQHAIHHLSRNADRCPALLFRR